MSRALQEVIDSLADEWCKCAIAEGDTLLVHSRSSRILRRMRRECSETTPNHLLQSFLQALGPRGTLVLPLFKFDFSESVPFDIRSTPSKMGVLTEAGRNWPGAVRTGHPMFSFAAIGREAPRFENVANYSGFGQDSPFAIVHRLGGKIAVLDLPENDSMTFYHYVEEMEKVDYRYYKTFRGSYTGWNGITTDREFAMYVRHREKKFIVHSQVDPMGEYLWKQGLYSGCRPNEGCGLRVISAPALFDATSKIIRSGKANGMLYLIERFD